MLRSCYLSGLIWLLIMPTAIAQDAPIAPITAEINTETPTFTTVSQLSDILPTHWAYEALQSLSERHRCGLSQNRFRGNQSLTRFELAAGLNHCLDQVLARQGVPQSDLDLLTKLQSEFTPELQRLSPQVQRLANTTDFLERQQFSPTTKLRGQAIFAINAGGFTGDQMIAPQGAIVTRDQPNPTLIFRASMDLDTSFNRRDLLRMRLVTGSDGANDNAGGFLEPNLGSTLDFSIPGRNSQSGATLLCVPSQPELAHYRRSRDGGSRLRR
jgi:hypothetical protein